MHDPIDVVLCSLHAHLLACHARANIAVRSILRKLLDQTMRQTWNLVLSSFVTDGSGRGVVVGLRRANAWWVCCGFTEPGLTERHVIGRIRAKDADHTQGVE